MKNVLHHLIAALAVCIPLSSAYAQEDVDRSKYPDYSAEVKADRSLLTPRKTRGATRPAFVNNQATKHFPPIFTQAGGSCGSASRIGYMFTHEINSLRDANAAFSRNQYPTHFTWLLTNSNSGKEGMAAANGIPNAVTYGGVTYSKVFGDQAETDRDFGWMQGYDKWYSAMFNRIERNANFPLSVETEEGREAVKNWLWNHNGDTDFHSGGVCGIGVASGNMALSILDYPENEDRWSSLPTTYYVKNWGPQVDHALTIVGYDDLITFDLDGNGISGEPEKDEVGAWIVVNSWGNTWAGNGMVYCPYKNAVPSLNSTSYYMPEIYYARKNYRPLRTLKILMDYSRRSELKLSAGISTDISATAPDRTVEFEHFKFAGNGSSQHTPEPEVPMLGKWADGLMHTEPMEFGYDLTDLSAGFDTRRPLKYFFIIESKSGAIGNGLLRKCALMDYEFDHEGLEIPFDLAEEGVSIQNNGKTTIISVVVPGEPINAPRNFTVNGTTLTWDAPAPSPYTLKGYHVYRNDTIIQTTTTNATGYTTDGTAGVYQIAAIYTVGDNEILSSRVNNSASTFYGQAVPRANTYRRMTNSGFVVKDIFKQKYTQATIEFWFNPATCVNWNQQIGPGWGSFLMHANADKSLSVGWSNSSRINTQANALATGSWQHVAVVVDGSQMTAYIDGELVGEITGGGNGIGGFGDLSFGQANSNGITAGVDEVRIWSSARTQREIQSMMYTEVANPTNTPGLLLELKMSDDADVAPTDETGKYICEMLSGTHTKTRDNNILKDKRTLKAEFDLPAGPYYTGTALTPINSSAANAIKFNWTNSDEAERNFEVEEPTFIFATPGEKTLTLTAYNIAGETATFTKTFTVEALPAPVPSFEVPKGITAGYRATFINTTTPADGCSYEWTMTGAKVEKAVTVNAAAEYSEVGAYEVTLKATNASGSATCTKTVYVLEQAPKADFEVMPSIVIKGAPVQLTDKTAYTPAEWRWEVSNAAYHNVYTTQHPEVTLQEPGVYTVALTATNDMGSDKVTRPHSIIVCNADGERGLNFASDGEIVTFRTPVNPAVTGGVTIDWWMYGKNHTTSAHHIGGSASDLQLRTLQDGTLSVTLGNKTFNTLPGVVIPSEWHHYAIVFTPGTDPHYGLQHITADIYKDGLHEHTLSIPGSWPTMPQNMTFGHSQAPMKAVIDEFRVWNKSLTPEQIKQYANQPIADVAAAEAEHNLALYYGFNQSGGNVQDATSNANHGTRTGFGPDGDAWSSSLGIFCLSNTQRTDVSADHLTNYITPFLHTGTTVNPTADQFVGLLQNDETSRWTMENAVTTGNITTGFCVNTKNESMMAISTKEYGFAGEVNDHKLYQTVTLPAGHYVFGAEPVEYYSDAVDYVAAATGEGLPNSADLQHHALAYTLLDNNEIAFSLYEETEVSLGIVTNKRGETTQHIRRFYLERKHTNEVFDETDICTPAINGSHALTIVPAAGAVSLTATVPTAVTIHSMTGVQVYHATISGTHTVALPAGLYIANGQKFIVK